MNTFACVDIGGTAIKYGILRADGTIVEKAETPTQAHLGGVALAGKVKGLVEALIKKDPAIAGVAISSAGVVDSEKGCIIHASDAIPGYIGVDYKEVVERPLGLPVEVENDVNCAGLAEAKSGAGQGASSMLMLTIGTGIGGCFIENGQLLKLVFFGVRGRVHPDRRRAVSGCGRDDGAGSGCGESERRTGGRMER